MEVKNLSTGRLCLLSKGAFESKGVQSVKDFFTSTTRGSTRGDRVNITVKRSAKGAGFPEKRLALVIGNSNYTSMSYLRNAQSDAVDVSTTLQDLGFDVIECFESGYNDMKDALHRFSTMGAGYDVILFYYAGHGVQEDGVNYLIPIDNPMEFKSSLKEALNADDVLGIMEACGAKNRMMFLDACRSPQIAWHRSAKSGLAKMEGSAGSVIMFSTESGNVASDGEEGAPNSPFATALMQNIVSNEPLSVVLSNICNSTYQLTGERQWPMQVGNLRGNFYFNPKGTSVAAHRPSTQVSAQRNETPSTVQKAEVTAAPRAAQPKMSMGAESVRPWIGAVKRVGSNCMVTLYLTNEGRKTLFCSIGEPELYDDAGNLYRRNQGNLICNIQGSDYTNSWILPGTGVTKIKLTLSGVPEDCQSIPFAKIGFRGMDSGQAYGDDELTVKNIPIGFNAPYQWRPADRMYVSFDVEDVDVRISNARMVNDAAVFTVTFTNNTNKLIDAKILGQEPCSGGIATMTIDGDGMACQLDKGLIVSGKNGTECKLPPGVPMKFTVKSPDFNPSAGRIPVFTMTFRDMPTSESYGIATLTVRDIPLD